MFRVLGLEAGLSRGDARQYEVMTVHLRGMELSNIWYSVLKGHDEAGVRGKMVSWGQIIYSYSEYRKERVQYVAVISTVCVSSWDPGEEEVNALVEEAVHALKLEQPVYSSDIVGFAESSSSSWRFRPRAKVGEVDVYYTYLEEKYRERHGLELDTMEQEAGEMGTSVFICGMPSWLYPRNGLDTGEGVFRRGDEPGGWALMGGTQTILGEEPEVAKTWIKGGYPRSEWSMYEHGRSGVPYGGAIAERDCRCSSVGM